MPRRRADSSTQTSIRPTDEGRMTVGSSSMPRNVAMATAAAHPRDQGKPQQVEGPRRAGLPPGPRRRIDDHLHYHLPPHLHLPPIDQRLESVQVAAEAERAIDLAIAVAEERLLGDRVGLQRARQFAAAVEAEVEAVQGADAAAVDHLGAAAMEIVLRAFQQLAGNAGFVAAGPHHDHAGRAQVGRDRVFGVVGPEGGVGETEHLPVGLGHEQARGIEVGLAEHELFESFHADRGAEPGLPAAALPEGGQLGRVGIVERSDMDARGAHDYSSIFVPSTSKNLRIHSGWPGQAAAVTRLPSTAALEYVSLTSRHTAPLRTRSGLMAG